MTLKNLRVEFEPLAKRLLPQLVETWCYRNNIKKLSKSKSNAFLVYCKNKLVRGVCFSGKFGIFSVSPI